MLRNLTFTSPNALAPELGDDLAALSSRADPGSASEPTEQDGGPNRSGRWQRLECTAEQGFYLAHVEYEARPIGPASKEPAVPVCPNRAEN
jgi:hypothetical protein